MVSQKLYLHEVYFKGSSIIRSNVICDVRVDLTFKDVRGCQIYLQSILSLYVTTSVSTSCFVAFQPRNLSRFNPHLLNTYGLHALLLPSLRPTEKKVAPHTQAPGVAEAGVHSGVQGWGQLLINKPVS